MIGAIKFFIVVASLIASSAFAETAQLKINGDLMIHPAQVAGFFSIASKKIDASSSWDWPALSFTKPYKTSWANVQARGPFQVRFNTVNLAKQEVGFELDWNDPLVHIGRFEIHDTVIRETGGARIIIHLDGACNGMQIRMPAGQWKVRGNLKWNWTDSGLQVAWQSFDFSSGSQAATVDLGQCEGPAGLHQALKDAIVQVSQDHAWMQDVLRDGVLDWVEGSLGDLQVELMKAREISLRPELQLTWVPQEMQDAGNGLIRVGGQLVMSKKAKVASQETLERTFDAATLAAVNESGFVLPRETLPKIMDFLQRNNELGYRASSKQIDSFQSLMNSRFLQFFVWPDLMKFAKKTEFYFDVGAEKSPVLTNGRTVTGGVAYDIQAPLLVRQWAPTTTQYLPYVDFRAPMQGRLSAKIHNGELQIQLQPSALKVNSTFRSEFKTFRSVSSYIANSLLGSRVADYLNSKPVNLTIPAWTLGDGMSLSMKGVKLHDQSFRIPLEFKAPQK